MKTNKYTTKLQLAQSHSIVHMYHKCCKRKSLNLIIPLLENIIRGYANYQWTPDSIKAYSDKEKEKIAENERAISEIIARSFKLDFIVNDRINTILNNQNTRISGG